MERCSECYGDVKSWRDNDANPELKDYIDSYVSPPKMYHLSLMDALKVWERSLHRKTLTGIERSGIVSTCC